MEKDNQKKHEFYYGYLVAGETAIVTFNLANKITPLVFLTDVIVYPLTMYLANFLIFNFFPTQVMRVKHWTKAKCLEPKVKIWFELPNPNDLRIYIFNPKKAKNIYVMLSTLGVKTSEGKFYTSEYQNELELAENSSGHWNPLFEGVLLQNDKREIQVGKSYNGKICLLGSSYNDWCFNFRDGTFEHVFIVVGNYRDNQYKLPDVSVWLTIKDGVLVEIKDKL